MISRKTEKLDAFARLLGIMEELREKCPWDKKQTFESLRTHTIEETHELSEAVISGDTKKISEELGDLLLHIVFYSKIGEELNAYTIEDVCNQISEKLIQRHPHVFGDVVVKDENDVKDNWEKIKLENGSKSTLSGVPESLSSLIKAVRIQEKARGVGFDWDHSGQVWEKLNEELAEFKTEIDNPKANKDDIESEFGDILFSLVNYARFFDINPDNALEKTNRKFIERFQKMEKIIKSRGLNLKEMTLDEMEIIWQESKK